MTKDCTETLTVGSSLPGFSLFAANRDGEFSLVSLLSDGALILEILRGTWCPNCRKRMLELEVMKSEIEEARAQLVYIAAEKRMGIWKPAEFLRTHPVSFPFLLDEDRAVTKAFGLCHRLGRDALNIAHPATLIVNTDGIIRYIYRGNSQSDRAPLMQVGTALRRTIEV